MYSFVESRSVDETSLRENVSSLRKEILQEGIPPILFSYKLFAFNMKVYTIFNKLKILKTK